MSEALLKAGLVTSDAKRRVEYEQEAQRVFRLHENRNTSFSEDDIEQISKDVAREVIAKKLPLGEVQRFVLQAITRHKRARMDAEEAQSKRLAADC